MKARSLAALAFGNFVTATGMLVITGMPVEMADDLGTKRNFACVWLGSLSRAIEHASICDGGAARSYTLKITLSICNAAGGLAALLKRRGE